MSILKNPLLWLRLERRFEEKPFSLWTLTVLVRDGIAYEVGIRVEEEKIRGDVTKSLTLREVVI